jgi:DNA-binding response OmpR family regulator
LDSSSFAQAYTRNVLEKRGYRLSCYASTEEADAVALAEAAIVLVDLNLRGSEEDEVDELRRLTRPEALILLVSSLPEDDLRERALMAFADGYVQKGLNYTTGIDAYIKKQRANSSVSGIVAKYLSR